LIPKRSVFDIELLKKVGIVQQRRMTKRPTGSVRGLVYPYGLLRVVYCAHCEQIALTEDNPKRRSRLSGTNADRPRYRHAEGVHCGCNKRSVPTEQLEADFLQLVQSLDFKQGVYDAMVEHQIILYGSTMPKQNSEQKRHSKVVRLRRQVKELTELYQDMTISADQYRQARALLESRIIECETATLEPQKKVIEFEQIMDGLRNFVTVWTRATSEERISLARGLFEYIVYDLDLQKIVDWRLQHWAEQYLEYCA
jgi:hypothetical protein